MFFINGNARKAGRVTAGGNHDFASFIIAFILTIDNGNASRASDGCASFKAGNFVFLEQKINATCQRVNNITFRLHHLFEIKRNRSKRDAQFAKRA